MRIKSHPSIIAFKCNLAASLIRRFALFREVAFPIFLLTEKPKRVYPKSLGRA